MELRIYIKFHRLLTNVYTLVESQNTFLSYIVLQKLEEKKKRETRERGVAPKTIIRRQAYNL